MGRRRVTDPIRFLGDFHDFIRVLYFLRRGMTKYEFAKHMSIDTKAAYARLEGWLQLGVVEKRGDKYYLTSGRIIIDGFGTIEVNDGSIDIHLDPMSKFVHRARFNSDSVRIRTETPKS